MSRRLDDMQHQNGLVLFTLQMPDAKKPSKCDIESSCHTNFDKATTQQCRSP